MIRTRFAPSPTGYLHIGGLRTALYAYLFAKKNNGKLILRIEDTDQKRFVHGATESLIENLLWAGILFDEGPHIGGDYGPYIQSSRFEIYRSHAEVLIQKEYAYYCFCSAERLASVRETQVAMKLMPRYDGLCRSLSIKEVELKKQKGLPFVVRLKIPDNRTISFTDMVRGGISFQSKDIDDQVLIKSDGFPTYHLANVVDDHLMEITHVIRAEEWLSSTPKHIILYEAFGWSQPAFAHLPLLLNTNRSKLSKRHNDVALDDYRKKGYLPQAIVNFVALLGWNPGTEQERFTMQELIDSFDLTRVHKAGAIFNKEKLDWLNGLYIREMGDLELLKLTKSMFQKIYAMDSITDEELLKLISIEKSRTQTLTQLPEMTSYFFETDPVQDITMLVWKKGSINETKSILIRLSEFIESYENEWTILTLEKEIKSLIDKEGLGIGHTLWPLRVALSGKEKSPSPFELLYILGKEKSLKRILASILKIK